MRKLSLLLAAVFVASMVGTVSAQPLRVLVTNDDGIEATGTEGGIDVLVDYLRNDPNLIVRVVAPASNASGSGDTLTFSPDTVDAAPGTTMGTFTDPNDVALDGTPADCVAYAIQGLGFQPDLVVSGINGGQNLGREIGGLVSGTVGAALTAGRFGVPAIAVSQQRGATDYTAAAQYVANIVDNFRRRKGFQKKLANRNGLDMSAIIKIDVPTCTTGAIRGVEVVPMAQLRTITGYVEGPAGTFASVQTDNTIAAVLGTADCESTLEDPADDFTAFMNGYISVSVLNPDKTVDNKLRRFRFLRNIDFE